MENVIQHRFWPGRAAGADSLRHPAHQKRHGRRMRFRVLVAVLTLAASLIALPAERALAAGQVLELPQATAPSAPAPAPYAAPPSEPAPPAPAEVADASPPPGVGGIDDYMHQDGQPHSANQSGYAQGYGQSYSSQQPDPRNSNPPSATTEAIVGAVALGLIVLDIYAAHHHHR